MKKICWLLAFFMLIRIAAASDGYYLNIDSLDLSKQGILLDVNGITSISQGNMTISANLSYSSQSTYDEDNDGIESMNGVVDYSISALFNWEADQSKLCTRWEIYSVENDKLTSLCYGNSGCCGFINVEPSRSSWRENLYLTYGMHGATKENVVSAQVIYVDYNLTSDTPYSNIFYSRWKSLQAIFNDIPSNISLEQALLNIEKIRANNGKIRKIELKGDDGKEVKNISGEENVSMVFNVSRSDLDASKNVIVEINGFRPADANWQGGEGINISTENAGLESSLEEIGISPKTIVSVKGLSGFLGEEGYYGTVTIGSSGQFDKVIYCPDDILASCRIVSRCSNGFEGTECYIMNGTQVIVFVPHFSSIILALDSSVINVSITSPGNSSSLASGENVYLNISSNQSASINYSLDGQNYNSLGNGSLFSELMNGTLDFGTFENGQHNLTIYIRDILGAANNFTYSFIVNDTIAPNISANITNGSVFNGTSLMLPLNISSDEYASVVYSLGNISSAVELGSGKSIALNITPSAGINTLTINATDLNQNSISTSYSFNFSLIQIPSCSDATKNGDETGIDCGGSCFSCINFSISTDKSLYNLTQNVQITVIARANSTVNVTVLRQNAVAFRHNFVPVFASAPIAESRIIQNTSNAGNYTINATMYYMNISETKNATFEVLAPSINPISLTISANSTTVDEGNPISFSSTVSGNVSLVSYNWDFQNDGTADSTMQSPSYTYPSNGTYTVNLTVSDILWNQTDIETITVRKIYNVTLIVLDNETGNAIQNAEVELDDGERNTSSEGKAEFSIASGRYDLVARKPGYSTFSNRTEINGNTVLEVYLAAQDINAPLVQLLGPADKEVVSSNVVLSYMASDASSMTCKLYLNENSTIWHLESTSYNVASGSNLSFSLSNLKNSTFQWQVECTDRNGNSNLSETFSFTIDGSLADNMLSVSLEEQDKDAEDIFSVLDSISADMELWSSDEKEAAEAIQLKKTLEKAKTSIQRANRDLHSLKWRRLNQSELDKETEAILSRIQGIKDTTPKKITVDSKNEFVKYPSKDDIGKALAILINSTNLKFSKKDLSRLVQENFKHQSLVTVTTKSRTLNIEYISGSSSIVTLMQKKAEVKSDLDNFVFYEMIPKEFARDVRDMELLFEYEVIENDPFIKIDIGKTKEYVYYVNKSVSPENTEKIKSILLSKELKKKEEGLLAGFVSLDGIEASFVKTLDLRLLLELVVIVFLLLVFLYYQFGDKIGMAFNKELRERAKEFEAAINKIESQLAANNYPDAKTYYNEAASIFKNLPKTMKADAFTKMANARSKMDFVYMGNSLNEAMQLSNDDKAKAVQIYSIISSLYKNLPGEYKSQIHARCMELHKKLN